MKSLYLLFNISSIITVLLFPDHNSLSNLCETLEYSVITVMHAFFLSGLHSNAVIAKTEVHSGSV